MITKRIDWIARLLAFLAVIGLPNTATGTNERGRYPEYYAITAPKIELNSTESVHSFTLDTVGAEIVRTKVPTLWNLSIDNSEGDRSHLSAHTIVGAWALGTKGIQFFDQFVEIAKENPNRAIAPPSFDVKLALTITDEESGKQRRVVFHLDRITLTRHAEP